MTELRQSRPLVLIVENEMVIASFLHDALESSGYGVAGPFVARASALKWLEKHTPELAVICTMLNDGSSREIAAALTQRGIPFIVYSGSRQDEDALREFRSAVWVEKPATNETLLETLASLRAKPRQE